MFRQRDELRFAGHRGEPAGLPIFLRLLDSLATGGDEIPPDVSRAFERGPAEEHQLGRPDRTHGDAVAWTEDQQPRGLENLSGDVDLAFRHIDGTLFRIG